jgi:hypothetical protein
MIEGLLELLHLLLQIFYMLNREAKKIIFFGSGQQYDGKYIFYLNLNLDFFFFSYFE